MQHWMRKNRRMLYIILAVLIVPSFVLWGVDFGGGRPAGPLDYGEDNWVAQVRGQTIGIDVLTAELNAEIARREQQGMTGLTFADLYADGTVDQIIGNIISRQLLEEVFLQAGYRFSEDFLIEELKQDPSFQTNGQFDPALWNEMVSAPGTINWNAIYASVADSVRRRLVVERLTAPARVIESDLRREFELAHTTFKVRYVQIEPPIEPDEEELRAAYEEAPEQFADPPRRQAEFVAISLEPPMPELVNEIVRQARAGADFEELAREHSQAPNASTGGAMDWVPITENMSEHRRPLANLAPGEVSAPVRGPGGWYIYKVEDTRFLEDLDQHQAQAFEILIVPELDPEEAASRAEQAEQLAERAQELGELRAAAEESGLEVKSTGFFSEDSMEIENVQREDVFTFRSQSAWLEPGAVSNVVRTSRNLYVLQVTSVEESEAPPFDEVRDEVREYVTAQKRRTDAYQQQAAELAGEIAEEASSIDEIAAKFPNISVEPGQADISIHDFDYSLGLFVNPRDIAEAFREKEAGAMAGPIQDFMGQYYFFELAERVPPGDDIWVAEWPEEKEQLYSQMLAQRQNALLNDYLVYLREQAERNLQIALNDTAIAEVVARDWRTEGLDTNLTPTGADPADADGTADSAPVPTVSINDEHDHSHDGGDHGHDH